MLPMTSDAGLKRVAAAVVGIVQSDLGLVPRHITPTDLIVQAAVRALDECGLGLAHSLSRAPRYRCANSCALHGQQEAGRRRKREVAKSDRPPPQHCRGGPLPRSRRVTVS